MVEVVGIALTGVISIVSMLFSFFANKKANEISAQNAVLAAENTRLSNGNIEIQIREMISQARRFLSSAMHNSLLAKTNPEIKKNEKLQDLVEKLVLDAQQDYLNAYEEACMKYIDNKIDQKRFYKTYSEEIRDLVRSESFKDRFGTGSTYTAIKKVYGEWNNLEK